ncbi:Retrovirus Pol polyprotein from transposon 17.6 [Fasciola gigantica]|uniref:Retrovirus Pol polyprotein from transposon 17.6 n=1 Tax=Fasciola gigantica TaxID=46835 RepID=A0A504YZ83_FASGI|nr:Retrovirus Pol polyprotein from transposon 17.6 [Fasciola gigantica]
MHPDDKAKTASCTPVGLFEFQAVPLGLSIASAILRRSMSSVLGCLVATSRLVHLDDVVVHGRTPEERLIKQGEVFQAMEESGLRVKQEKYELLKTEFRCLGHIVGRKGMASEPEKISAVESWPTAKSTANIRQLLGLTSYYHLVVKNYADIAFPLHRLTEKNRKFL